MNKPQREEVLITLSALIQDLEDGLTWLTADDAGNGSIQAKYKARDRDILAIMKHPKLMGLEPNLRTFLIKDDLNDTDTATVGNSNESSSSQGSSPEISTEKLHNQGSGLSDNLDNCQTKLDIPVIGGILDSNTTPETTAEGDAEPEESKRGLAQFLNL